jgi:tRNA pseudouridine65 synthase
MFRERFNCQRLLLHAHKLDFEHPHGGAKVALLAPLGEELQQLLVALDLPAGEESL